MKTKSLVIIITLLFNNTSFAQHLFHNLPWDLIKPASTIKGIAECGFTSAGFVMAKDIPLCKKLGLQVIVSGAKNKTWTDWNKLSDDEIDSYIKNLVSKSGNSKAIMGYYIVDEPSALAFPALAKAVKAVKKYAPGKLAYINLFPNYATLWSINQINSQLGTKTYTEYLERFVNEVKPQFLSYDNYMVQHSMDLKEKKKATSYYTNLLEVRRIALKYNLPFWNVVSSNQIRPVTTIPSPANLLFQAYTTLAAGAKGIEWYTYYQGGYAYSPLDKKGNKTLVWRNLQEVNKQIAVLGPVMNQLTSIGVYFTDPAPDESLPLLPGKQVEKIETNTSMMIGEFVDDKGIKYIMVVNLSLERSVKFKLQTKTPQEKMYVVSAVDAQLNEADKTGMWLTAGGGILIKVGD